MPKNSMVFLAEWYLSGDRDNIKLTFERISSTDKIFLFNKLFRETNIVSIESLVSRFNSFSTKLLHICVFVILANSANLYTIFFNNSFFGFIHKQKPPIELYYI